MSRKVILSLIVVMAVVMISLILVQTNAINKALQIKKSQFDQTVTSALSKVVTKLEREEMAGLMLNQQKYAASIGRIQSFSQTQTFDDIAPRSISRTDISISLNLSRANGNSQFTEEIDIHSSKNDDAIKNERGRPGEFPSAFDKLDENRSYLNQQYRERLNQQILYYEFNQNKIRVSNLPIEDRINPRMLDTELKREFRNSGIDLDFEYAVKSFQGNERFIFGSQDFNEKSKQKQFSQLLFENDLRELMKPNYLYVYFPKREGYLLKETGVLIIPTIILTAMLIGIFIYTILIILKQKKLSIIKNDFINNMTHELKTPISTISLASQMLRDNTVSNTARTIEHVSNVIHQESKRLSFQVEKVLQMAVFNEGRLKLKFKEVNLNDIISSVVSNFDIRVKNKNGNLTSSLDAKKAEVKGDEVHITNVLFNLLDNAVKYSKEIPEIDVSTHNSKGFVVVSVKDNGIGIPKEHVGQIFERFYRVPTGNVHDVKGFGLGLSYVKKIVDSHHGKIKVESTLHKGTKFMIYFPLNAS